MSPTAAVWGLQLAFLSPALALILVNLYGATTAEVGWVLGVYNGSGFIASLLPLAYADKTGDYQHDHDLSTEPARPTDRHHTTPKVPP